MSAVEFIRQEFLEKITNENYKKSFDQIIEQAKVMEKEQRGYSESDMRSYASYILNNPVIEPSQWYKIYRTKSE